MINTNRRLHKVVASVSELGNSGAGFSEFKAHASSLTFGVCGKVGQRRCHRKGPDQLAMSGVWGRLGATSTVRENCAKPEGAEDCQAQCLHAFPSKG